MSNPASAAVLSPARTRLALLALALGGFGIGATEFVAMGLLPQIARDLLPTTWLTFGNRTLRNGLLDSPPKKNPGRKVDYHIGVLAGWRLYTDGRFAQKLEQPNRRLR